MVVSYVWNDNYEILYMHLLDQSSAVARGAAFSDENQALCCATCRRPVTAMRRVGRDGRTLTVEAIPLTVLRLTATVRLYAEEEKHQKWAHAFLNRR